MLCVNMAVKIFHIFGGRFRDVRQFGQTAAALSVVGIVMIFWLFPARGTDFNNMGEVHRRPLGRRTERFAGSSPDGSK